MPSGVYDASKRAANKPECQCEWLYRGGAQCPLIKAKGTRYCRVHREKGNAPGSNSPLNPFAIDTKYDSAVEKLASIPKNRMAFYTRRMGPKLKALVEEALEGQNAHDISEEVAIVRAMSQQSLQVYNSLMELDDTKITPQGKAQAMHDAGQIVVTAMDQATRLSERSAKIFALTAEKIDPLAIDKVAKQLCRFVYVCFEDYETELPEGLTTEQILQYKEFDKSVREIMIQQINKFDKMVSEELQLPSIIQNGTNITPDQQVLAMINTVPFVEE